MRGTRSGLGVIMLCVGACSTPVASEATRVDVPLRRSAPPAPSSASVPGPARTALAPASDAPISALAFEDIVRIADDGHWQRADGGAADTGLLVHHCRLDRQRPPGAFAGLLAVDFPQDERSASLVGREGALYLDGFRANWLEPRAATQDVLAAIVDPLPDAPWTEAVLRQATQRAGLDGATADSDPPRYTLGVRRITGGYRTGNTAVDMIYFDYAAARAEGRVLVDGRRVLFVTICSGCPPRWSWRPDPGWPGATPEDVADARAMTARIAEGARTSASSGLMIRP